MTSYVTPKKGFPFICYVGLTSQSTGQFQSNPTLAAGDFKISKDGAALANLATLPAVTPAASKSVKISLDSDETNADNLFIIGSDAAGAEWDDIAINIQTTVRQIDDLATPTNITAGTITTVTNLTNAPTNGDFTTVMKTSLNNATPSVTVSDKTGFSLSSVGIQAIWDALTSALTTVGSIGKLLVDNINATISSRLASASYTAPDNATISSIQSDTNDIQSRLPAALSGDGFIKADVKSIDDELTNGNNATLNLKQINILNNNGTALIADSSGGNGYGAYFHGNGTGYGIDILGGSNQNGLQIDGGFLAGSGVGISSSATGFSAISIDGAAKGIEIYGEDGDGVYIESVGANGKSINAPQDIAVSDGDLTLAAIANAVWTNVTRTLTAISDSAGVTTLLSRIASALNISGGKVESNVKQINDTNITGNGSSGNPWGPV